MADFDDFIPLSDDELNDITLPDVYGSTPDAPDVGDTPVTGDVEDTPEFVGPAYAGLVDQFGQPIQPEEVLEEEAIVTDMFDLIPIAITQQKHLQITYTGVHSGMSKDYVIEPYEIGGHRSVPAGFLWGFDIAMGTIKSFYLSNISDIQLLETTFIPRFS